MSERSCIALRHVNCREILGVIHVIDNALQVSINLRAHCLPHPLKELRRVHQRLYTLRFTSWNSTHPEATCIPKKRLRKHSNRKRKRTGVGQVSPNRCNEEDSHTQAISKSCTKHEAVTSSVRALCHLLQSAAGSTISLARLWFGSMPTTANSKNDQVIVRPPPSPAQKEQKLSLSH